jgi:hypothetical protein
MHLYTVFLYLGRSALPILSVRATSWWHAEALAAEMTGHAPELLSADAS